MTILNDNQKPSVFDITSELREHGLSTIALLSKSTPVGAWSPFQSELPTPTQLQQWFSGRNDRGYGE